MSRGIEKALPFVLASTAISILLAAASCSQADFNDRRSYPSYCQNLLRVVSKPDTQSYISNWVTTNIRDSEIRADQIQVRGLQIPGRDVYAVGFDWETSNVRLVGLRAGEKLDGEFDSFDSIFLGERSRYGVLVDISGHPEFGLGTDSQYVTMVSPSIGVLCIDVDW